MQIIIFSSDIVDKCYHQFTHPDTVTLSKVGPYNMLEMWHGPTGSFKDLALSPVGSLMDHFLSKKGQRMLYGNCISIAQEWVLITSSESLSWPREKER